MIEIKNYRSCTKISHQVLYGNVSDERERKKGKKEQKQIKYPKIETLVQ